MTAHRIAHTDTFAAENLPPREAWPEFVFGLPELRYPEKLNAAKVLLGEAAPDRAAVHNSSGGVWTYGGLLDRANRVARVLTEDMGLAPGNRVLLRAANTPELIAAWFGVLMAGGVVVATMPLLRASEIVKVVRKAEISHALVDSRLTEDLEAARVECPSLRSVMTFGAEGELEGRMSEKASGFEAVETAAEDVAIIAFTSGTTGDPKGCIHSHRDLLATCDTFGKYVLDARPDEVFTGTPPLAFTYGLGGYTLFPMRVGASVMPIEKPSPDGILAAVERGATTLFTAPTAYRALLEKLENADVSSLQKCVSAGESLPRATSEAWFEKTGIRITDGIGSTEMLHIFIASSGEEAKPGSTGKPVPGYEAMVADDGMRPVPAGEVGRLAVRGPTGCRYLDDARQSEYVVDGWNVTGDAYVMDENGYFWFQARTDDMIVASGYNVSGPEVEAALMGHDAVSECAVVAAPDEERGTVVKAFVVAREGASKNSALVEGLQNFVKASIAPYKYPRKVEFLDKLPKTPTGKIQRFLLREREVERFDSKGGK